jgi:hypothetical protein
MCTGRFRQTGAVGQYVSGDISSMGNVLAILEEVDKPKYQLTSG